MAKDPRCEWLSVKSAKYQALSIKVIEQCLDAACRERGAAFSLSASDHEFLSIVANATAGDISMAQIARELAINPSSATRKARHLQSCGLISKTADASDDRRYLLALTPFGRVFWEDVDARLLKATEAMYSTVTEDEMNKVISFTEKCIDNLQRILDGEL